MKTEPRENHFHITDTICKETTDHTANIYTFTKKSLPTLDGEIADPEITVKLEMRDVLKVHDEQT